jgi:hypothetical protein
MCYYKNNGITIARTLNKKTRKETNLKFYKIMAVPVLLYGSEIWTPRKRDWSRIQAAEMKYLRTVKGCTRLDQIRNKYIRNEFGISPFSEKIVEYRNKRKSHLKRMEHTRIPLQAYKYQPSGKGDISRPRRTWGETTILEAGTGDSPTPLSDDDDDDDNDDISLILHTESKAK